MSLIGIIAKKKDIKEIKNNLDIVYEVIEINNKSIENLKNIKFEQIIINKDLALNKQEEEYIKKLINTTKYIIINADINIQILNKIEIDKPLKIITYGFNSKSTISISSVKEDYIILSIQREIEKLNNEKIENQEKKIELIKGENNNIYIKIIKFIIKELHNF